VEGGNRLSGAIIYDFKLKRSPLPLSFLTFLTRLFFFWVQPVLTRGYQRNKSKELMTQDDLLVVPGNEDPSYAYKQPEPSFHPASRFEANREH